MKTQVEVLGQRIDKLEVALVLLLNCLRDRVLVTQEAGTETEVLPALPASLLDHIEKLVLTRV